MTNNYILNVAVDVFKQIMIFESGKKIKKKRMG